MVLSPEDRAKLDERVRRVREKTSATQLEAFAACERKWYNGWVLGFKAPSTPAQIMGTATHEELEHAFTTGTVRERVFNGLPLHALVKAALPFFPPIGSPGVAYEREISRPTIPGGPLLVGRADALVQPGAGALLWGPEPGVIDTKTTSDFRYMKSPAELADNIQLGCYGSVLADELGMRGGDVMNLRHVYPLKKVNKAGVAQARAVDVRVTVDDLRRREDKTLKLVERMMYWTVQLPPTAEPLPPTGAPSECSKYGGCEHRARCGLDGAAHTWRNVEMSDNTTPTESILDRMRRMKTGAPAPTPTAAPAAPTEATGPAIPTGAAPQPAPTAQVVDLAAALRAPAPNVPGKASGSTAAPLQPSLLPDPAPAGNGMLWTREGAQAGGWVMRPPRNTEELALAQQPAVRLPEPPKPQTGAPVVPAPAPANGLPPPVTDWSAVIPTAAPATPFAVVPPDAPPRTATPEGSTTAPVVPTPEAPPAKKPRKTKAATAAHAGEPETPATTPAAPPGPVGDFPKVELPPGALTVEQLHKLLDEANGRIKFLEQHATEQGKDLAETAELLADAQSALERADEANRTPIEERDAALRGAASRPGAAPARREFVLLIDAVDTKGFEGAMDLEDWLAPIAEHVAKAKGVADWRLIQYTAEGDLAVGIADVVRADPTLLPEVLRISGASRARGAALDVLVPHATKIVRGTR